jgi:aminocarboxymuconate-semialdehyde decarboxylase
MVVHSNGVRHPVTRMFHDVEAKLEQMDRDGIDLSVVSLLPRLFLYWIDPEETLRCHRFLNDATAKYVERGGGRLQALAMVPLNHPEAAAVELRRCRNELGLVGVQIGTCIEDVMLDDESLDPFYAAAAELRTPVLLHPYRTMGAVPGPEFAGFHLSNVIGNPLETCVAATRMVVGGVFDRHPDLKVHLVHGGGTFPYQLGRLEHAYVEREDTKAVARRTPSSYLENFLFDTILFDERALRFLVSLVGPDRVLFGTDVPLDMCDPVVARIERAFDADVAERVLGKNALREYGL